MSQDEPVRTAVSPKGGTKVRTFREEFYERVDRGKTNATCCWTWIGTKDTYGYGRFVVGGVKWKAHRYSLVLEGERVTADLVVRHDCDNPSCVRPSHLRLGTQAENVDDMISRGRRFVAAGAFRAALVLLASGDVPPELAQSFAAEVLKRYPKKLGKRVRP